MLNRFRVFHPNVRLLLIASALQGFSVAGVRVVLFNLYLLRLGYGPEFVGLATAAGWLALSAFSLVAGAVGSRWGSRRGLIAGFALMMIGTALPPLAEWILLAWQAPWLVLCSVLTYVGSTLHFVNGMTYLMGTTGLRERQQAFATQIGIELLAGFAGSLIGGALPAVFASLLHLPSQHPTPYWLPQSLFALLLIPGIMALVRAGDATEVRSEERMSASGGPPYALLILMSAVVMLRLAGRGAVGTFFNVYLDTALGASTALVGVLTAVAQLLSAPAALSAAPVVQRWGTVTTLTLGSLGLGLSIVPLALIPHWTAAGLGLIGVTALFAMTSGPIRAYSQQIVPPEWRGLMSGVMPLGVGLVNAAMALGGGYAVATLGFRGVFLIGAALSVAGALLFWGYFRVPRGELAGTAESASEH
jgi:MFS family permease